MRDRIGIRDIGHVCFADPYPNPNPNPSSLQLAFMCVDGAEFKAVCKEDAALAMCEFRNAIGIDTVSRHFPRLTCSFDDSGGIGTHLCWREHRDADDIREFVGKYNDCAQKCDFLGSKPYLHPGQCHCLGDENKWFLPEEPIFQETPQELAAGMMKAPFI
jgi:hypothetical protein